MRSGRLYSFDPRREYEAVHRLLGTGVDPRFSYSVQQPYGVIFNSRSLRAFQTFVVKLWQQDTRKANPKGSRYLGVLQKACDPLPAPRTGYPSGLAQMIAPPPVLPEEPAAVTPHGGFREGKASNGCATR